MVSVVSMCTMHAHLQVDWRHAATRILLLDVVGERRGVVASVTLGGDEEWELRVPSVVVR